MSSSELFLQHLRFRHISDALVSLNAFFPPLPAKRLHGDAAHRPWVQAVWSDTWGRKQTRRQHLSNPSSAYFSDAWFYQLGFKGISSLHNALPVTIIRHIYCTSRALIINLDGFVSSKH